VVAPVKTGPSVAARLPGSYVIWSCTVTVVVAVSPWAVAVRLPTPPTKPVAVKLPEPSTDPTSKRS
jgi:hypothetical protein